jgi:hypothetical protein
MNVDIDQSWRDKLIRRVDGSLGSTKIVPNGSDLAVFDQQIRLSLKLLAWISDEAVDDQKGWHGCQKQGEREGTKTRRRKE